MEIQRLKIKDLAQNKGQIPGLPTNPRQWTREEIDKIARSLKETPELFEARPIIVTPWESKFIILGGNLRYEGCKVNKDKDAPCIVIPEGTPVDKMKEIVIKDNGSFGAWDYDSLANLWDDKPLVDWGVPAWNTSDVVDLKALELEVGAAPGKSDTGIKTISFCFKIEDAEIVEGYIKEHSREDLVNKIVELCQDAEVN